MPIFFLIPDFFDFFKHKKRKKEWTETIKRCKCIMANGSVLKKERKNIEKRQSIAKSAVPALALP